MPTEKAHPILKAITPKSSKRAHGIQPTESSVHFVTMDWSPSEREGRQPENFICAMLPVGAGLILQCLSPLHSLIWNDLSTIRSEPRQVESNILVHFERAKGRSHTVRGITYCDTSFRYHVNLYTRVFLGTRFLNSNEDPGTRHPLGAPQTSPRGGSSLSWFPKPAVWCWFPSEPGLTRSDGVVFLEGNSRPSCQLPGKHLSMMSCQSSSVLPGL